MTMPEPTPPGSDVSVKRPGISPAHVQLFPSRAAKILSELLLLRMTTLYCRIVLFVSQVWLYSGLLENS